MTDTQDSSNDALAGLSVPTPDVTTPTTDDPTEQRVPLDRFRSVTQENQTLRSQLDELSKWKQEQEDAALSEVERERVAREKAEADAASAHALVKQLERGAWVRSAAVAAGFADPEDAVALIDLDGVSEYDSAATAVRTLADAKPHLVAQTSSGPRPMAGPLGGTTAALPTDKDGNPDPRSAVGQDLLNYIRRGN